MKINGVGVAVCPMHVEQVDSTFIMHNPVTGKVIMLNRTASLIWDIIVDHSEKKSDICTRDFVTRVVKMFDTEDLKEGEVQEDVEGVIAAFFGAGLLRME